MRLFFILLVAALVDGCGKPSATSGGNGSAVLRVLRNGEHGVAVSSVDIGYGTWEEASAACDALILDGHDDWRLPDRNELDAIYRDLYQKGIGDLKDDTYWTSGVQDEHHRWAMDFGNGRWKADAVTLEKNAFRAVRKF